MAENNGLVDDLDMRLDNKRLRDFVDNINDNDKPVIDHAANLQFWRTEIKPNDTGFVAVDLFIDKGKFGGRVEEKELCKFPLIVQCADYCFDHGRESVYIKTGHNHEEIIKRG